MDGWIDRLVSWPQRERERDKRYGEMERLVRDKDRHKER